jgi:hypothetical protein
MQINITNNSILNQFTQETIAVCRTITCLWFIKYVHICMCMSPYAYTATIIFACGNVSYEIKYTQLSYGILINNAYFYIICQNRILFYFNSLCFVIKYATVMKIVFWGGFVWNPWYKASLFLDITKQDEEKRAQTFECTKKLHAWVLQLQITAGCNKVTLVFKTHWSHGV